MVAWSVAPQADRLMRYYESPSAIRKSSREQFDRHKGNTGPRSQTEHEREPTAQIDEKIGNAARRGINSQRIALARLVNGHMQCQKMQPRPAIDPEPQEDRIGFCGTSRAAANGERGQ